MGFTNPQTLKMKEPQMSRTPLFDPVAFMNENAPANATKRDPRPIGEALGQVLDIKMEHGIIKNGERRGQPWYRMDAKIEVTDPEYLALRQNPTGEKEVFFYGMMYDADDTGRPKVGPNVNVKLGIFREACGANGKPWGACIGMPIRINVGQKPHPTEVDAEGNPIILDEVLGVTKA
jgi:hypothetical protein